MKPKTLDNNFSADKLELIKRTITKGATDDEFRLFIHLANKYDLDPFAKEIWFIKYNGQIPSIFASRDGYLKIAHSHVDFDGIRSGAVHANDEFVQDAEKGVTHQHAKGDRGAVVGGFAVVHRKAWRFPVIAYAPFAEYNQASNQTWKKYPTAMIMKVAEAMALKRAFSITGLFTHEEMETRAVIDISPEYDMNEELDILARLISEARGDGVEISEEEETKWLQLPINKLLACQKYLIDKIKNA